MDKPKSAIEAAREFGVDIDALKSMLRRTPTERLLLMQSMAQLVLETRATLQKQGVSFDYGNTARLRRPIAPAR